MDTPTEPFPSKSYALSGKIMLTCIIVLFSVMILMVILHLYARWYLHRARERHVRDRRQGRTHLVFYAPPDTPSAPRGLANSVLESLPIINYTAESSPKLPSSSPSQLLECAVCLSEFNEGEKVRLLPKCNHSFHLDCIDMWFYSHKTCPLCRSPVEKFNSDTPSLGARRKEFWNGSVRIEVPRTQFEAELVASSPASYRSPVGRLRSLTRILSMGRRSVVNSPKDGAGERFDSAELDLERGAIEPTHFQVQTPR